MVYTECQVILFGIKTYLDSPDHREMLLNPENNYIIKSDDLCVYMCESPREVEDINALVSYLYLNVKSKHQHICSI